MKKVFSMSILIFLIFLVAGGCQQKPLRIITGEPVVVTTETIGPEGGTITINKPGDPLNGLSIEVPEGAFSAATSIAISYRPVTGHNLGNEMNTVSPLISINNGDEYAEKVMTIKIPVSIADGQFAMAFFYDAEKGRLEGIPVLDEDSSSVTILTRHVSDIITISSSIANLDNQEITSAFKPGVDLPQAVSSNPDDVASTFKPGTDDWHLANEGSYIYSIGNCGGMSLSALWYFLEQKPKSGEKLWDQNPGMQTPDFWQDDALAIKLCSVVQKQVAIRTNTEIYDKVAAMFKSEKERDKRDKITFYSFVLAMKANKGNPEPQLVNVYSSKLKTGHVLVCYKIKDHMLYVADPNYPGMIDEDPDSPFGKISYENNRFISYQGGENIQDILSGKYLYDAIRFFGQTSAYQLSRVKGFWNDFKSGTIGAGSFPSYTVRVVEDKDEYELDMNNDFNTTAKMFTVRLTPSAFPDPRDAAKQNPARLRLCRFENPEVFYDSSIELNPGKNVIGLFVEGQQDSKWCWAGFNWVNVVYEEETSTSTTTSAVATSSTTTTTDGTSNRLIWSYDLGEGRHVFQSPVVADGKVYFTTYIDGGGDVNSGVFCLDAATGNLVWKYDPDEFPVGTYQPLVTGGKVFVTTSHGYQHANVTCLDAASGSLLWEKDVTDTGSPFSFANDLVYAGSYRRLYALQPASGEFAWYTNNVIFASTLTTPAVVGDYLYTTDGEGNVYCVQYKKGEPEDNWKKWTFSAGASYTAAPSVANGKVYVSNSDLKIFCLDALSGQKVWELAGAGCSSSHALAVVGDKIYTSQNNKAVCTSTSGSNVWETPLGTGSSSDVAVSDLYVYVATRDDSYNKLLCINAGTGAVVWEYAADNFSMYGDPVVSGGFVYIGCDKNKICCLQAQEGDGGSWPMYKYNVSRTSAK